MPVAVPDMHLVLHGLAIKKHADAAAVAGIVRLPVERWSRRGTPSRWWCPPDR